MKRWTHAVFAAMLLLLTAGSALAPTTASALDPAFGHKRALAIAVNWEGAPDQPASPPHFGPADLVAAFNNEVNPTFSAMSRQQFYGWDAVGAGPYTIANPGSCDDELDARIADRALAAAEADGFDRDDYDQIVFQFSTVSGCGWLGLAQTPGKHAWVQATNLFLLGQVMEHELGHTLGLRHAFNRRCVDAAGARVPLSDNCRIDTPDDRYAMMGDAFGDRAGPASQQWALGWMTDRMLDVTIGNTPNHLLLRPIESFGRTTQAVRVQEGGVTYWIENYTTATGIARPGVLVRQEGVGGATGPWLLDMSPTDVLKHDDAGLLAGRSWNNPLGELRISVNSISELGADITVGSWWIPVPDLTGLSRSAATSVLTQAGLAVGTVDSRVDSTCNYVNTVMDQVPGIGVRRPPGAPVRVTIGLRPRGGCQ